MQANESEDYVMVEFDLKSIEGKENVADDDSYDYCDDLYSVHSSGEKSNASASEAENSVLSVPSGLLKELDEAHAAAKLAIPQDSEDVTTVQSSQSVTICATEDNIKQTNNPEKEEKAALQPAVPIKSAPLSRVSNKKRRKQMKLMKKAKAAAQASKALSEKAAGMATSSSSKALSKAKKTAKKSRSKRVHPHVACAHEEIAAYKDEVRMMGKV